jgi:hypothetical protein
MKEITPRLQLFFNRYIAFLSLQSLHLCQAHVNKLASKCGILPKCPSMFAPYIALSIEHVAWNHSLITNMRNYDPSILLL